MFCLMIINIIMIMITSNYYYCVYYHSVLILLHVRPLQKQSEAGLR